MSQRYGRDYRLTLTAWDTTKNAKGEDVISSNGYTTTIQPPFDIEFSVTKSNAYSVNQATITVYNLSKDTYARYLRDIGQASPVVGVELSVGYVGSIKLLSSGDAKRVRLERRGTDTALVIEVYESWQAVSQSTSNKTVRGHRESIEALAKDLYGVDIGKITDNLPKSSRPQVLVGNTFRLLQKKAGDDSYFFIDNKKCYFLKDGDVVGESVPVINADTGMLNVPQRQAGIVNISFMLNPDVRVMGLCKVESALDPTINGVYVVMSMVVDGHYRGEKWDQRIVSKPTVGVS